MSHPIAQKPTARTLFARGMEWGFAHIQLEADEARVEILTTPDDGSGASVSVYTQAFPRRTGRH